MLWAVRLKWPSGAHFTFNCYRHWDTLVVRDIGDESGHFLHSKERMTEGDPLAMIAYGIGVLPLIRELREAHPRVTQPCYSDDAGAGETFIDLQAHYQDLQAQGRARDITLSRPRVSWSWPRGTSPGLTNISVGSAYGWGRGHWYLGGFLGDMSAEREWFGKKIQGCKESVAILSGVTLKHPQSAYEGPQKSLQQEWAFVQRVNPGVGTASGPAEEALREVFVPALFHT